MRELSDSRLCATFTVLMISAAAGLTIAGDRPLTVTDLMKMRSIHEPRISADGLWVAYGLKPDRGDGVVVIRSAVSEIEYRVPRGEDPTISVNGRWVAMAIEPSLEETERARRSKDEPKPRPGLAVLDTADGSTVAWDRVRAHAFSENGRWLALHHHVEGGDEEDSENAIEEGPARWQGSLLILRELASGREIEIPGAVSFAFDGVGSWLAVAVTASDESEGRLLAFPLTGEAHPPVKVHRSEGVCFPDLAWPDKRRGSLAYLVSQIEDDTPGDSELWLWKPGADRGDRVLSAAEMPDGWHLPPLETLEWRPDGQRLLVGLRPGPAPSDTEKNRPSDADAPDLFDIGELRSRSRLDVWHWDDAFIQSQQKAGWDTEKERTYLALVDVSARHLVQLADTEVRRVVLNDNPAVGLGVADTPYARELTWVGELVDAYAVDLESGDRRLVARRLWSEPSMSPDGRFVAFCREENWYLFDVGSGVTRCLTCDLDVSFAEVDHDRPEPAPAYGLADWVEDGSAVLLYDRFDIWKMPTDGGAPVSATAGDGRRRSVTYRVVDLEEEREGVKADERLLVTAFHRERKDTALYSLIPGRGKPQELAGGAWTFSVIAGAEDADRLLYTRERYDVFPDLWVAGSDLSNPVKLSSANPEMAEYAWGSAQLVRWRSDDGVPLEGVLITPDGHPPGERLPVLVYFYRLSAHRLHLFNEPVVNHRPSFPLYVGNGYAVFLPDIRFEVGRPGLSAVKCLVPGVHKLVEMGVADPDAIGLHGHSWGGYQTAFVVTQTDIFAAAVAGAPVSNMTSAYGGIRYKTGLARQFQYEQSQSRLGVSLWQGRDRYIENSPLFYADRIRTPLLIQHGDADGAVPWTQSVELYLAMRRLRKECYLLQYRDEPHHLKEYPNKLDYTLKMKEFFDHHLKGAPAPDWMRLGVDYRGQ